jgi:hypothetical protein
MQTLPAFHQSSCDGWCLNQATSALHATKQEKHLGGSGLPQGAGEDSASQGALCCRNDGRTVSALQRLGDGPEVSLRSASSEREKRASAAVSLAAARAMGAGANTGALAGDRFSFRFSGSPR